MVWVLLCILCLVSMAEARPKDRQAPTITITAPTSGTTYASTSATVTLAGTASDKVGVTRVTWSAGAQTGMASGTTSWAFTVTLPLGSTTVTVRAFDAAGNSGQDTLTVTVLTPPPPVSHTLAWEYQIPVPETVVIDQCISTAQGCPMAQVTSVPGSTTTAELGGLDSTKRYCWEVRAVPTGERSNRVCSA